MNHRLNNWAFYMKNIYCLMALGTCAQAVTLETYVDLLYIDCIANKQSRFHHLGNSPKDHIRKKKGIYVNKAKETLLLYSGH